MADDTNTVQVQGLLDQSRVEEFVGRDAKRVWRSKVEVGECVRVSADGWVEDGGTQLQNK